MGIRPYSRGQVPVRAAPDSAETRFKPWVDDLEDAGAKTGEVWADTDAKASSSNEALTKLSGDLTALEGRVDVLEQAHTNTTQQQQITNITVMRMGDLVTVNTTYSGMTWQTLTGLTFPTWAIPRVHVIVNAISNKGEAGEFQLTTAGVWNTVRTPSNTSGAWTLNFTFFSK